MPATTTLPSADPLAHLAVEEVDEQWTRRGLDRLADAGLVGLAARHVAVPRLDPADSFVLHAPLELMARSALLRHAAPADREPARRRIATLAATYDAYPAVERTTTPAPGEPSVARLRDAIAAGDLDEVDRVTAALAAGTTAADLVTALADLIVDRLSAAGHGAIFLYHLPRLLAADPDAASMARGLLREVARHPDWRLSWMDHRRPAGAARADHLTERLLGHPDAGRPESHFIFPTMTLVERAGLAAALLDEPTAGLDVAAARRSLTRVAAWSMLQDDPAHAPYGWSHALTMPQATLGIAGACTDPGRAVAVAATWVLGFRATMGRVVLDPAWSPEPRRDLDPETFLAAGAQGAAAALWHAPEHERAHYVERIVGAAVRHEDAHLAKYTLACLDAARDDPGAARLHLAAAAHLAGWWAVTDDH